MMTPQKVVLQGARSGHDDEIELGPFTQGVVAERTDGHETLALKDVAGGGEIAIYDRSIGWIVPGSHGDGPLLFRRVFVQTYPSAHDALTVSRRDQAYSDVHEDGDHVLWAKHAQAELYVAARRAGYDHDGASHIVDHLWARESA